MEARPQIEALVLLKSGFKQPSHATQHDETHHWPGSPKDEGVEQINSVFRAVRSATQVTCRTSLPIANAREHLYNAANGLAAS
ncbi:hypothetical protein LCGC14_2082090 [marine sediment metagenome]|uniref:Transposase n=1 Tax=marine sediment metagenome TaxID=412755 RepID=A0A0F9EFH9_9ZZZZ